jgi:hypothetical protein
MPIFYFHLYDEQIARGEEGLELPDLASARERARFDTRALIAEQAMNGEINLRHRIEVEDAGGRPAFILPLRRR